MNAELLQRMQGSTLIAGRPGLGFGGAPLGNLFSAIDEDTAQQIAPVLESFVEHVGAHRRFPWRGGSRSDETPI